MKQGYQLFILVLCCFFLGLLLAQTGFVNAQDDPPPESPLPTPTPTPLSPVAEAALQFVVDREGIPSEELTAGDEHPVTFPLLERSYSYITIYHTQPEDTQLFSLLVDPTTLEIEPDYNAMRDAENAARRARYGKLEPTLHERLKKIGDDEEILVAIWLAHSEAERSFDEIVAAVVARYPAAEEALAERGFLWAVDDPELAVAIQVEYERLRDENSDRRATSLIDWLRAEGVEAELIPGMPAVSAALPKRLILALNERDDVAAVYAFDAITTPESDIAIATDRTPIVWSRGYDGNGVNLAILEEDNINNTAALCLNIVQTRATGSTSDHKSRVAAVAGCNDNAKPGMAPGAEIVDAGHDGTIADAIDALEWATDPSPSPHARVVNWSEGTQSDRALHLSDRAYDYWVRERGFTGIKSAGNTSGNVTSPGKGYNIITVGNFDDQDSATWANDEMHNTSAYINPDTGLEKPEVAAPGTDIDTVAGERWGTSYAAPQVAGLAALLIDRNVNLQSYPTAVKAIIMASAVHNIEGGSTLSTKDGAGGINAPLADWIAQSKGTTATCTDPCWWNVTITNTAPALNGIVERKFRANRGEKIRVAIAWLSDPDPPTDTSTDMLRRNFDLQVLNPNGSEADKLSSPYNSFEVVEFTAAQSGEYKIRVKRNSSGDGGNESGYNYLGIAWVKDATYLPDVREDSDGQTSTIYIRNNGATVRTTKINFYDQSGSFKHEASDFLEPNEVWAVTPPSSWQGSAIINGGEDIVAVVRNAGSGLSTWDNVFSAMNNSTDYTFEQAATTLYVPAIYNNIFGGLNSTLYVQNTSTEDNDVTVSFIPRTGTDSFATGLTLSASESDDIPVSTLKGSTPWVGSAVITADYPVTARVYESQGAGTSRSFNASAAGRSLIYVVAAYKAYGTTNLNTGLVIQNLSGSNTNVTVTYCKRNFTNCIPEPQYTLSSQRAYGKYIGSLAFLANGWTGSVKIQSNNGAPLAVAVTNSNNVGGYDFNANNLANLRSRVITLPYAAKAVGPVGSQRTTGYTLRNISGPTTTATVKVKYYNLDGTLKDDSRTISLIPGEVKGYHQSNDTFLSSGWEGSVVLESDLEIIAIMREDFPTTIGGYNGIPR